jgi:tRNA dimethylallyltransferase
MRRVILVSGPTASGKSALALALAERLGGEVVNADSQQVYVGLDIGTAKPTRAEQARAPHHLYDVAQPWEQLDAARFVALADEAIAGILARGRVAIVVGGTGLWLRALRRGLVDAPPRDDALRTRLEAEARAHGLGALHDRLAAVDPESAARIHRTDPVRIVRALEVFELAGVPLSELHRRHREQPPRLDAQMIAVELPMAELEARIEARVERMFAEGLVEETLRAAADPRARARLERVMGYREALALSAGRLSERRAMRLVATAQRQYAKRQFTWLRAEDDWRWIPAARALDAALETLSPASGPR